MAYADKVVIIWKRLQRFLGVQAGRVVVKPSLVTINLVAYRGGIIACVSPRGSITSKRGYLNGT